MKNKPALLFLVTVILSGCNLSHKYKIPDGWHEWGHAYKSYYSMGVDSGSGPDGGNACTVRSNLLPMPRSFGTLMQEIDADRYVGKRIRLSGIVRSKSVHGWAGIWLRIDNQYKTIALDNMYDRGIRGTSGWTKCACVLDVPQNAIGIGYGGLLSGRGQMWFDSMDLEVVSDTVATTTNNLSRRKFPVNMHF